MSQVKCAGKEKSDADKEEIMVVLHAAGIPGKNEDHKGHKNAEHLDEAVKEHVTIKTARVQREHDARAE
jgi:hypothetical protein